MTSPRKSRGRQLLMLSITMLVMFATAGCGQGSAPARVGELRTKSESVELGDAESVQVLIHMAAGELIMSGGASQLLEANFTYNVEELEPEVEYSGGTLVVSIPDAEIRAGSWWDLDDYRYEWDLRLSDDVPMEMKVDMAAGSADLELGSLSLAALSIETGASEVKVDLADSLSLRRLDVEAGLGQTIIDLSGDWQLDLDANISSGAGQLTLRLPRSVCVRVDVEGGLSNVETHGLARDGSSYVNEACGEAEITLRVDISAGLGTINLEEEE